MRFYDRLEPEDDLLSQAVVVEISNVRQWCDAQDKNAYGENHWKWSDFPHVMCPWNNAFFEYQYAHKGAPYALGMRVLSWDEADDGPMKYDQFDRFYGPGGAMRARAMNATYMQQVRIYADAGHEAHVVGMFYVALDAGGAVIGPLTGMQWEAHNPTLDPMIPASLAPYFMAISFAHCKNVRVSNHATAPKVAAKRQKAGKPVGVTYKTLVIDPMKEVLRTEGGIEKNGAKKALHICRGHFATYTADKPLFGRVTGTFWKPMHVRGNKARGEVKKDYRVLPKVD